MIETYLSEKQELRPLHSLRKDVSCHRIGVKMLNRDGVVLQVIMNPKISYLDVF